MVQEENLRELVSQYPVLFGKSQKDCGKKDEGLSGGTF